MFLLFHSKIILKRAVYAGFYTTFQTKQRMLNLQVGFSLTKVKNSASLLDQ